MALQALEPWVPGVDGLTNSAFDVTQNDSSQLFPIGMRVKVWDTSLECWGEVAYHRGVASNTAGDANILSMGDEASILLDDGVAGAEIAGLIGWALAAIVASEYGWFHIWGRVTANVAADFADNGLIYATTTAGTVDDAAGGGQVLNARSAGAIGTPDTGQAYIDAFYASIAGTSAGLA